MVRSRISLRNGAPAPGGAELDSAAGWLVVGAAFLTLYTVFGVSYSFTAFFNPMADEFGTGRGGTAFFFALTTLLYFAVGALAGPIADRIGPRPVLLVGGACLVLGLLATSRVGNLYLGYLTYGVGVGIGVGCCYVPMVATVGGWFARSRTTALGVAVAGIGVGTLVNAPLAEWLIARHGWRNTYVMLALGAAVLLTIASFGARRPPVAHGAPPPQGALGRAARTTPFWLLYSSMMVLSFPLFLPFVFMGDYIKSVGGTRSAGVLVGTIGISSVVGRLALGALASRLPSIRLYQIAIFSLALSLLLWLNAGADYGLLLLFAVCMGVSYGGFIALAPAVTADTFGTTGLGAILGVLYTAAGIGGFIGPQVMGTVIDRFGYTNAITLAIILGGAAGTLLLPIRPGRA